MEHNDEHALVAPIADKWEDPCPKAQARNAVLVWFGGFAHEPTELKDQRIFEVMLKLKTGLPDPTVTYIVGQLERTKTGRLHVQMYAEFTSPKTRSAIREKILGRAHKDLPMYIARRRGSPKQASEYCKKFDSAVANTQWEHGQMTAQGTRHDVHALMATIQGGARMREIITEFPEAYFDRSRGVQGMVLELRPKPDKAPKTCWIWGSSATLKTASIKRLHGQLEIGEFEQLLPQPWFTYRDERVVLFDEIPYAIFHPEHRASLLKWTGMGCPMLPVKNGFNPRIADYVYATSNWDPMAVLAGDTEEAIAIRRRWNVLEYRERLRETAEERSARHPATYRVRIWRLLIHPMSGAYGEYKDTGTFVIDERDKSMTPEDAWTRDRAPLLTKDESKLVYDPVTREWVGGVVREHANHPDSPLGEAERARQLSLRARGLGL